MYWNVLAPWRAAHNWYLHIQNHQFFSKQVSNHLMNNHLFPSSSFRENSNSNDYLVYNTLIVKKNEGKY